MSDNANAPELTNQITATTTQGHAFSDSDWLDAHFEAAREAYEAAAHYAGIQPGWKLLDAGADGGSYLSLPGTLVGDSDTLDAVDLARMSRRCGSVPPLLRHHRHDAPTLKHY